MEHPQPTATISRIGFIGNYLPRQCGIATFTTDLCESVAAEYPAVTCIALPVNDIDAGYDYPPRVRFELAERDLGSYRRAADFLNLQNADVVCLQHEYGIFGGRAGAHILTLLRELRMPVVTTLHTILREPTADQRRVLEEVAALSDRLVVMSDRAAEFLSSIYSVPAEKIDLIPHGIPDVPFVDPSFHKDLFSVEGKTVLLSFGLLSPNKGLEHVIAALPAICEKHPNVVYMIVGATHPHVKRRDGESYRLSLQVLAHEKGVEDQVRFYNHFVSLEELIQFIGAADIYITPYLNEAQITSGTLAYTLGAGKAVVSTPYWYAEEMLADNRGALVPFSDPAAMAQRVTDLLDHDADRHAMRKRAYLHGRAMIWPQVAQRYMETFERARLERRRVVRTVPGQQPDRPPAELPPLSLDHLRRLSDDTGLFQHALFTLPNYAEGYTTDDNARGLLISVLLEELGQSGVEDLANRYFAFLVYAFNNQTGRFRNFMDFQRRWLEEVGSEDSHGRALWALGTLLGRSNTPPWQRMAGHLFNQALPAALDIRSPRATAFALLGVQEYLRRYSGDRMASMAREELSGRLFAQYRDQRTDEWRWFEDRLTYCNAILPHALIACGRWIPNPAMLEAGLESLAWLADIQRADGEGRHFLPIGSYGFYIRGGERARFDQQPVEAQAMISACLEAYHNTGDGRWRREARRAFSWFLGRNDLGLSVYDPTTGGCRDGLQSDRLNENQGAESTIAFLHSLLEMRLDEDIRDESLLPGLRDIPAAGGVGPS